MTQTAIQRAVMLAIPAYRASLRLLATREERDTLRDLLCTAIAKDYLREIGALEVDDEEKAA